MDDVTNSLNKLSITNNLEPEPEPELEPDPKLESEIISNDKLLQLTQKTCKLLNSKQSELSEVKWTDGESNTDTDFSRVACKSCEEAFEKMKNDNIIDNKIKLKCNIPDINCVFTKEEQVLEKKIELKSCKGVKIIGSTIRKLDINQPLIYCLRSNTEPKKFKLKYSQYHQALSPNEYDSFQDRTPRPTLLFDNMKDPESEYKPFYKKEKGDWISEYAHSAINRLNNPKYDTWQEKLVSNIRMKVLNTFIKNTSIEEFIKLKNEIKD